MRLADKIALLEALPSLGRLEHEALHVLAFSAEEQKLGEGQELFRRDAQADGGYLILTGGIVLKRHGGDAGENFGPGALLGESALIAETTRPATAVATAASQVLFLPRALVRKVLDAHPDSAQALRRHVAATVATTEFELRNLVE